MDSRSITVMVVTPHEISLRLISDFVSGPLLVFVVFIISVCDYWSCTYAVIFLLFLWTVCKFMVGWQLWLLKWFVVVSAM